MKRITIFAAAILIAFCASATDYFDLTFVSGEYPLLLQEKNLARKRQIRGDIRVFNGKSEKHDHLDIQIIDKDTVSLQSEQYTLQLRLKRLEKLTLLEGELCNRSSEELLLQPELIFFVPKETGENYFFNGHDTLAVEEKTISRLGLKGRPVQKLAGVTQAFPVGALISPGMVVFVGQPPHEMISYHGTVLSPISSDEYTLSFLQRHAIGAQRNLKFRLLAGLVPARYGLVEAAVQAVFDSFPKLVKPVVGQDNPYIWGTDQYLLNFIGTPDYELSRRYHCTLTWLYAPFKRAGDMYGRKELWDYTPHRNFQRAWHTTIAGIDFDYRYLTWEEFHQRRRNLFSCFGKDFGYAFYNTCIGLWSEETLVKKHYPDAINDDTDGVQMYIAPPWINCYDNHIRTFPLGTSYGKVFREDTRKVFEELAPPGFAFDGAGPGAFYRGPAAKNPEMPGRAWDEKGVFIDQSVAVVDLVNFTHALETGDKQPFVWLNGVSGHGDIVMYEYGFFDDAFPTCIALARYNAGQLPMLVRGNGFVRFLYQHLPNWRTMSKTDFLEEVNRLCVYTVFNCYKYGLTGLYTTMNGNALAQYTLPELLECRRLGWQPQIPIEYEDDGKMLYKARYGRAENSVIFIGNPYENAMPLSFKIEHDVLGKAQYLWVRKMRDRAKTENFLHSGLAEISDLLLSRAPCLYESVCGLSHVPASGLHATVSSKRDLDKIKFTVKFKNDKPFQTAIIPRSIRKYDLVDVRINGQAVEANLVDIPVEAELVLEYASADFHLSRAELQSFPFANAQNEITVLIRLPENPNDSERRQAERMHARFEFDAKHKVVAKNLSRIVQGGAIDPETPQICISVGRNEKPCGVSISKNLLRINSVNAAHADALLLEFNYHLDQVFEYFMPFRPIYWNCISMEMQDKFEIWDETLPFEHCFESEKLKADGHE